MSSDEIRRLAEDQTFKAFVSDGPACIVVTSKIKAALLAFAAMVERCEEKVKYLESIRERGDTEIIDIALRDMNYILKGDPDEDSPHGS